MSYFSFRNYDFLHLDAFSIDYIYGDPTMPPRKINIDIEFGFHCFTNDIFYYEQGKRIRKNDIQEALLITHKNETREFDLLRYEQSKFLPQLIKTLFENSMNICFNTTKDNKGKVVYFRKEIILHNSLEYEYYIFFNSTKDKHILFYITSAYHRNDQYYKKFAKDKIKLNTIVKRSLS